MANPAQIDESIKNNDVKPIFADNFLLSFRIRAKNANPAEMKMESATPIGGLIELTFVDESKQQALGRFVIDKDTADNLCKGLFETVKKFEDIMGKEGLTKILPKTEKKPEDKSYR